MNIYNIIFTGSEIETIIQRSNLSDETQSQLWAMFEDYAHIDKRFNTNQTPNEHDAGDEHPILFV